MRSVGFPINNKENEQRRAIIPEDVKLIRNKERIYIENNYGYPIGYSDEDYIMAGANIACRDEILQKDIICDPKTGDADYIEKLNSHQVIFGWVHAVQNRTITDKIVSRRITAIAWEDMFEDGRHSFWRNNEIAGEAAIMHAYCLYGKFPYETTVAILGRGNIARGAYRAATALGAEVHVYDRKMERLFRKEIGNYDVIVNGILWDIKRKDHIIYREDLKRMKRGAMIIDVSCDSHKGIETSEPTTINNPVYMVDGILHYVVDHTPALFYKTVSMTLSKVVSKYLDIVIEEHEENNEVLNNAIIVKNGIIIDKKIKQFQNR